MGYSCSTLASKAYDSIIAQLQDAHGNPSGSSNAWGGGGTFFAVFFAEIGRERPDGAVTGKVHGPYRRADDSTLVTLPETKSRSFRIEPDGRVTRFYGASKAQRDQAARDAVHEAIKIGGGMWASVKRQIGDNTDHPAHELVHAKFVAV